MTKLTEEKINNILKSGEFLNLYEKYKKNIDIDKLSNFFDDIETNKNYFRLNIKKSNKFFNKNKDTLTGLYDMFESGDMADEISDMLQMMESKTSTKPLRKEFKRIGGTK